MTSLARQKVVEVMSSSCSRKQEPRLTKKEEECSTIGADGRTKGKERDLTHGDNQSCAGLSQLVTVSIGWQIGDVYHEQIGVCHDEKVFSTIWSNYTLEGTSIDFRWVRLAEKAERDSKNVEF